MRPDSRLAGATGKWAEALGSEKVIAGETELAVANRATFDHPSRIAVVLRPTTRGDVSACLAIAAEHGVPLHPVSRGRNWGYGSRLPVKGEAALLSLDALNTISDFDNELGLVTVEPGVTLSQLGAFLEKTGWWPPQTGAGIDTSIVGNVLERGIGKGPYEDMSQLMCGCEVMLPNGTVVRTGMAAVPGARPDTAAATAPGPAFGGLFAQSNFGVILSMTLRLHPRPQHRTIFWATMKGVGALTQCVDRLRPWLQRWPSGREASLLNGARVQSQTYEMPDTRYQQFVGADIHDQWVLGVTLWSDDADDIALRIRSLRAALGTLPVESGEMPEDALKSSAVTHDGLRTAYWAKGVAMPPDPDPDRDGCGVIWVVPIIPMRGAQVAAALAGLGAIMRTFGFPPGVSLRLGDGKTIKAVIPLLYDRNVPGADTRATDCAVTMRTFLLDQGLVPYRLSIADMGHVPADSGSAQLSQAIKAWADPHGIISPGRYTG